MELVNKEIDQYAFQHTVSEPELLQELQRETYDVMEWPTMITGRMEGRLLKMLVQILQARRVLELGTFTGYSALCMAEGLPEDGIVTTCECNSNARDFAKKYFAKSPVGHKIDLVFGNAIDTLPNLIGEFDFIFIDADKGKYLEYYEICLEKLRSGGVMAIDNMLWSGKVLKPNNNSAVIIHSLNERITNDDRVENVLLTVRDGLQLIRKK